MNLQNLVDYCEEMGLPSPFAGATVPAPLNIDTCISAIMVRCGLLTPCYNDPDTFRNITTIWFERKQWTFEHLINVIQAKYSPIENVFEDRTETTEYGHNSTRSGSHSDTESGTDTVENSGTDTVAESGTDERDISNTGTDTTTNTISAFNSNTYQPDNQSELSHGLSVDDDITYGKSTDTTHGLQTDTTYGHNTEHVYNNLKDQEGGKDVLTMNRHGNVGTVSANKLIMEELSLLRHFDIYGYIADIFEDENMLMIY